MRIPIEFTDTHRDPRGQASRDAYAYSHGSRGPAQTRMADRLRHVHSRSEISESEGRAAAHARARPDCDDLSRTAPESNDPIESPTSSASERGP